MTPAPTGLTPLICNLIARSHDRARAWAMVDRIAAKHGLSEATVRWFLETVM